MSSSSCETSVAANLILLQWFFFHCVPILGLFLVMCVFVIINSLRQKNTMAFPFDQCLACSPLSLWHYTNPTHMSCSPKFFAAKMERLDSQALGLVASYASSLATLVTWSPFSRPSSPISSKALISKTPFGIFSVMAYSAQTAISVSAKGRWRALSSSWPSSGN
ncbi:hypothetical protein EV1_028210 [Malus domestica]